MLFLFYFVQNRQLEANELLDKIYQSVVSTEENTPLRERLLARLQTRKSLHQMDIQLFAHFSPERCKQHKRLFQRLGDKEEEAYCDLALAKYQSGTQQTNEAYLACAESALRQFREVGHVYFQAYTLSMLGHSELYPGNEEQGIAYLEEGMRLSIQAGQPLHYYELKTSCALSVIFCTHDLDKARRYLDECESMAHAVMSIKLGIPFGRGWLAQHAGHSADAIRHMQTCLEIAQKTKRYGAIANIHSCLGFFYALDKRAELAQQHFTESANALEKGYGRRSTIAAIRVRMAYFHICQGELERARTHLQSALQVDRSISKNSYLLEITAILALFQWHTNQRKEALQLAHNLYRNKHLQPLQKRLLQEIISEPQAIAAKTGDDGSVATLSELISQYDVSSQTTE